MLIGERLRDLRKEKGFSKKDFTSLLPLNYSTYANYESGFREPGVEVLVMLAKFYHVSVDYILGLTETRQTASDIATLSEAEYDHVQKYRQLDEHGRQLVSLIMAKESERIRPEKPAEAKPDTPKSWVTLKVYPQQASAMPGNYLHHHSSHDCEQLRFASTPVSQRADFCVRIKGGGMEPKIGDGDIVFVKAMPQIDPDSVGIFVYENEAYCKRLRIDPKKSAVYLESLNKSYAPKHIAKPHYLRTVGLVIGIAE